MKISINQIKKKMESIQKSKPPATQGTREGISPIKPKSEELTIFVGGLSSKCTSEDLNNYFQQFGSIIGCEPQTWKKGGKKCRGFALIHCADEETHSKVLLNKKHLFNGRTIECKRWFSSKEKLEEYNKQLKKRKLFVGGLPSKWRSRELEQFFSAFGKLDIAYVITHPKTGRSKGFGYIVFQNLKDRNDVLQKKDFSVGNKTLSVSEYSNKETIKKKKWKKKVAAKVKAQPVKLTGKKKKIRLKKTSELFQFEGGEKKPVKLQVSNPLQHQKFRKKKPIVDLSFSESTTDSGISTLESSPLRKVIKVLNLDGFTEFERSEEVSFTASDKVGIFAQEPNFNMGLMDFVKNELENMARKKEALDGYQHQGINSYSHFGELNCKKLADKFNYST